MSTLLFKLSFGHRKVYFSSCGTFLASTLEASTSPKSNDYLNGEWNLETNLEAADLLVATDLLLFCQQVELGNKCM